MSFDFLDILYVIFFFITHKQIYSSNHFTGASSTAHKIIGISATFNLLFQLVYTVFYAIKISILKAVVLFVLSIVITLILNVFITRLISVRLTKDWKNSNWNGFKDEYYWATFNRKCDVNSTTIAVLGVGINITIIIAYFFMV